MNRSAPILLLLGFVVSHVHAGRLEEVTVTAGFTFRHYNGASGEKYPIETMAGGVAFLDADGDGDLDIYAVNGAGLPGSTRTETPVNRLFRNDGAESGWTFTDITGASGAGDPGYGMGCATADYDNDGDTDLYVTNYGANALYRNEGGGRFVEVTEEAGVGDRGWGMSAAFLDIEGDGDLDLYLANYVQFDLEHNLYCTLRKVGVRGYCHPDVYPGQADVLYRNNGDGTFTDITRAAGVYNPAGKGLGVVCADVDLDGDVDIYVANDSMENYLYSNKGDGTFEDVGLLVGAAFNEVGHSEAGMGVDAGDINGDGYPDIFIGHLDAETNTFYLNRGDGTFQDVTSAAGMAAPSLMNVTFGLAFLDADNDGDLDAFVGNGHVLDNIELASDAAPYRQKNQLYVNEGGGRFADRSDAWGMDALTRRSTRGVAAGDYDNDGRVDLLLGTVDDNYDLVRNVPAEGEAAHWALLKVVGAAGRTPAGGANRDGIGARVTLTAGDLRQTKQVHSAYSYCSAGDIRLHFGLGNRDRVDALTVYWPGGREEHYDGFAADQALELREGEGLFDGRGHKLP